MHRYKETYTPSFSTPAFSTLVICCHIFHSGIFSTPRPCTSLFSFAVTAVNRICQLLHLTYMRRCIVYTAFEILLYCTRPKQKITEKGLGLCEGGFSIRWIGHLPAITGLACIRCAVLTTVWLWWALCHYLLSVYCTVVVSVGLIACLLNACRLWFVVRCTLCIVGFYTLS